MKYICMFLVSIIFLLAFVACSGPTTKPQSALKDINEDNAFVLYNQSQSDSLEKLRINPEIGLAKGIVMNDSVPPGQISNPEEDFVLSDQTGQTTLLFQGVRIFQNSWNFPYESSYKMKTDVRFGSSAFFSVISLYNISLFEDGSTGTELKIWFFDESKILKSLDLSRMATNNFDLSGISNIVFYNQHIIFLDVWNGWPMNPGPHELVAYDLNSGEFKKFAFH